MIKLHIMNHWKSYYLLFVIVAAAVAAVDDTTTMQTVNVNWKLV